MAYSGISCNPAPVGLAYTLAHAFVPTSAHTWARIGAGLKDVLFCCDLGPDEALTFHFLTDSVKDLLGLDAHVPIPGNRVFACIHPLDAARTERDFRLAGQNGTPWQCSFRIAGSGHATSTLTGRASIERQADGKTTWYGSLQDVSVQEQALTALRAVEERYRLAMDAIGLFVWEWDPETDTVTCDPRLGALLGETGADHFTGRDWRARIAIDDTAARESFRTVTPNGPGFDFDVRLRRKDGGMLWLRVQGRRCQPDLSAPPRVIGIAKDVSDSRVMAEALAHSEAQLRAVFELSPLGMVRTALDGAFLEANPAFCQMLGFGPEDLLHRTFWELTPPAYAIQESQQLDILNTTGRYGPYEKELVDAHGNRVPVLLRGLRVGEGHEAASVWSIIEDLREKHSQDALVLRDPQVDRVTGLASRGKLAAELEAAVHCAAALGKQFSLLCLDVDNLKVINENLGRDIGDAVLAVVAQRLRRLLRPNDLLARYMGSAFVVLRRTQDVPDKDPRQDAGSLAMQMIATMGDALDLGTRQVRLGASVGIAVFPDDGGDAGVLLRHADAARHQARVAGPARFRFFDPEKSAVAVQQFEIESALWSALEQQQLELFYQPQIDLASGRPVSLEALLRWRRPGYGMVLPSHFIPVAENSSLILRIGEFVLTSVCEQMQVWRATGVAYGRVAINVSTAQLQDDELVRRLRGLLDATGIPPDDIELEVTETALIEDPEAAGKVLGRLRSLGIHIAIDDFGTGYSSLAYLRRLPITAIKIDRSFVTPVDQDPAAAALAESIVHLGQVLGLDVVAEGIETEAQERLFAKAGCPRAQGFRFAHPMPAHEIAGWLARHPRADTERPAHADTC